jgi:hypothetical protein
MAGENSPAAYADQDDNSTAKSDLIGGISRTSALSFHPVKTWGQVAQSCDDFFRI